MMNYIEISYLTDDELIVSVGKKYWELNEKKKFAYTVKSILGEYGLLQKELNTLLKNVRVKSNLSFCSKCNTQKPLSQRSEFIKHTDLEWTCNRCLNEEREKQKAKHQQILKERKDYLLKFYPSGDKTSFAKLCITDMIYLLSVIRIAADESMEKIIPIWRSAGKLSPTEEYDNFILRYLLNKGIISIDPDVNVEDINYSSSDIAYNNIPYRISVDQNISLMSLSEKLESTMIKSEFTNQQNSELVELWKKISVYECMEIFIYSMKEYNFSINNKNKSIAVFSSLLEKFSVSKIFNLIYRSVKDTAALFYKKQLNRFAAVYLVLKSIQSYSDRAHAEDWNIKDYQRNYNLPQSMVSQVLFNLVLKIGDNGFTKPPSLKFIKPKKTNLSISLVT